MKVVNNSLRTEAIYEPLLRKLARSVNERSGHTPRALELWVRIRPPSLEELYCDSRDPSLVRFHRIGSVAQVNEVRGASLEVLCGGISTELPLSDFLETWVRVLDWGALPSI